MSNLESTEDHLHIKHEIIHQVVYEDLGNRKICIKYDPQSHGSAHSATTVKHSLMNHSVVEISHSP
jgi:hypothetical protein